MNLDFPNMRTNVNLKYYFSLIYFWDIGTENVI
jgi:hypothetical protein